MTIKAKLTANGVKPDLANVTGGTVTPGLTATGSTATDAYKLSLDDFHLFTTVALGTGCILAQNYAPSDDVVVANDGANPLNIFPPATGAMNGGSVGWPLQIAAGTAARLKTQDGINWWSA